VSDERAVSRKELASAGRDAMKALLLRPACRQLLGELIGCWGEKMIAGKVLVWPSNEYLCRRTGLSVRAVRYGIRSLIDLRLIAPKDSANGKRFAIKNRGGEIVDVYGFDLTPVYDRAGEWVEEIREQELARKARSRLFDEVTICRRAIQDVLAALAQRYPQAGAARVTDAFESLVAETPRRNLSHDERALERVTDRWRRLRSLAEETFYSAASGGKTCSHIETKPSESLNRNLEQEASGEAELGESPSLPYDIVPVELTVEACPAILEYVEAPRSEVDLVAAARVLRSTLGASPTVWSEASEKIGPLKAAAAVCLVLQLYENDANSSTPKIRNPGGYLRSVVRMVADGRMNLRYEMMTLIRKRGAPE
jgi:replication initiation protein RepC